MSWELYGDEKFNYMLEIEILRSSSQKNWMPLGVNFKGFGVELMPRHPAAEDYVLVDTSCSFNSTDSLGE